jgi:hypothetical protein
LRRSRSAHILQFQPAEGSIEEGRLADLAILAADFLTVPGDQIMNIKSYDRGRQGGLRGAALRRESAIRFGGVSRLAARPSSTAAR